MKTENTKMDMERKVLLHARKDHLSGIEETAVEIAVGVGTAEVAVEMAEVVAVTAEVVVIGDPEGTIDKINQGLPNRRPFFLPTYEQNKDSRLQKGQSFQNLTFPWFWTLLTNS